MRGDVRPDSIARDSTRNRYDVVPHALTSPVGMRSPDPVYWNDGQIGDCSVQIRLEHREFEELQWHFQLVDPSHRLLGLTVASIVGKKVACATAMIHSETYEMKNT